MSAILSSVLNWRKLRGSYLSTRKSNPVRVRVNVRRAAGRTIHSRIRCALCTLAIQMQTVECWRLNMQCEGDRQFSTEQSIVTSPEQNNSNTLGYKFKQSYILHIYSHYQ